MTDEALQRSNDRNLRVGLMLILVVGAMVGAAYAAVPLYYAFCAATGFGGTPQVASSNPKGVIARDMTVRFDSNVETALPWIVTPSRPVTASIGEVQTIEFTARNLSDHPVTGQAVFNVTPEQSGIYFNKIECFCFTEQTLQPGETVKMPVTFFVDPDLDKNPDMKTLQAITLSYTFYAVKSEGN
jgi:cytochrome c oxidase assembly protein subunit 11